MPPNLRYVAVDYSIFELSANAAVSGIGVALPSPTLFRPLVENGLLVAPFSTVLKGPEWYFALIRQGDKRPTTRSFCDRLCEQVHQSHE